MNTFSLVLQTFLIAVRAYYALERGYRRFQSYRRSRQPASPLLNLPDELWVKIFNLAKEPASASLAEQGTQPANNVDMLPPNVRSISKKFRAIYDATLYPRFLSTFRPTIYDDTQYQLLVNQIGEPNNGQVHLSLENGFLKYHLRTLDGRDMEGMLNIELKSQLSEQAVFNHKDKIHHELSAAIQVYEVKMRLIAEMDKLLPHEEAILAKNPQSTTLQGHFTRLKALRQSGLYQIFNLLESEHYLEHINTEIVQAKIDLKRNQRISGINNLSCRSCYLTRFPKTVLTRRDNAEFWANLHVLNLTKNQLENLPVEIGKLVNLKILFLNRNELQCLPPAIGRLIGLLWLSLDHNQLQSLPAEIGQLMKLQKLSITNNRLFTLPSEIGQLQDLDQLFIEENRFQFLPEWLNENILCKKVAPNGSTKIDRAAMLELQEPIDGNEIEMMAPGM